MCGAILLERAASQPLLEVMLPLAKVVTVGLVVLGLRGGEVRVEVTADNHAPRAVFLLHDLDALVDVREGDV